VGLVRQVIFFVHHTRSVGQLIKRLEQKELPQCLERASQLRLLFQLLPDSVNLEPAHVLIVLVLSPAREHLLVNLDVVELRHLLLHLRLVGALHPGHHVLADRPHLRSLLDLDRLFGEVAIVGNTVLPPREHRAHLVLDDDFLVELSDDPVPLGVPSPSLDDLEEHRRLNILMSVVLLPFLDEGLAPVPEVLSFLDTPHLLRLAPEDLLLQVIMLESTPDLSHGLQHVTVHADGFELANDHSFFEGVEDDLHQFCVVLLGYKLGGLLVVALLFGVETELN